MEQPSVSPRTEEEKVFYSVPNTFIKFGLNNKEHLVVGTLYILDKLDGCHIEWRPTGKDARKDEAGDKDSWSMVNVDAVGFTNNKTIELTEVDEVHTEAGATGALFTRSKLDYIDPISFHIAELKSFKRSRKSFTNYSSITFILSCGTTHLPIFFQKGGTDKFAVQLEKKAIVSRSSEDVTLFLVSLHTPEIVVNSFDRLNLFEDQGSALQRFVSDPVRNTFTAFAKVSGVLTDAFINTPDDNPVVRPELYDQLRSSIDEGEVDLPTVNDSQDPEFLFVDQKVQLPNVQVEPRMSPLDIERWEKYYMIDGRVNDPEHLKCHIFRGGISPPLRQTVWKFLLSYYPWNSSERERDNIRKAKHDEYFTMKAQWKTMSEAQTSRFSEFRDKMSLIEKDVIRTDRTNSFFSGENNERLTQMYDVLMTYVMYNFDLGYVQGMSDLLSPILLVMDSEVDSFWCFVGFMNLVDTNFEMDQEGMKLQLNQLNQLLQVVDRNLYNYLESQDSSNMFFTFRWLLILFKREFSMEEIMSLWEVIWTGLPCKNYQLVIAVSLLLQSRNVIMDSGFTFNEILKHINDRSGQIDLNELLMSSEALAEQLTECDKLPSYVSTIIRGEDSTSPGISPYETLAITPLPRPKKQPPPRPDSTPVRSSLSSSQSTILNVEN